MPTYRYRCERCGDEMEVWQSFSEEPLHEHDTACGGQLLRVLTPAGIVLKGPGFYKTDSRSSAKKHGSKKALEKSSPDSKGSDSKGSSDSNGSNSQSSDSGGSSSDSSSSKKDTTSSTPASTSSGSSGSR